MTIIVVGTLANDPYAGMAWMHMQMVVGFLRLGHNAYYFEITSAWPQNPELEMRVDNVEYAVPYLNRVAESFGIGDRWAYRSTFASPAEWYGMSKLKAEDLLANADIVFNVSSATRSIKEEMKVGRLVYYGTDPVYHEIMFHQKDEYTISLVNEHDDVVTYGENIGNADCPIPALPNLRAKTRQPVLMDHWSNNVIPNNNFTTIGNWKQGGRDLSFNGEVYYWSKHHEFLKFMDVPLRTDQSIELAMNLTKPENIHHGEGTVVPALGIAEEEYMLLISNGWKMTSGPALSRDPMTYRDYIIHSRGEFTFAKDQNIRLRSGWFSERSACYLAAGRPVITQDTGFSSILPTGEGLFAFTTIEDIIYAFEEINSNYKKHSQAALDIAQSYFKAETVLAKLLHDLGG